MPDNDNAPLPPIQLLAVACQALGEPDLRFAWLHGYALLTLQPTQDDVHLSGMVMTGERYVDDLRLTTALADALDPDAVLAGVDLTGMISRLSRLPLEVIDQAPALALLGKLQAMLQNRDPIDLTIDMDSQVAIAVKVVEHKLLFREGSDDQGQGIGLRLFASPDNLNPNYLAAELADTVGAAALAIGDLYLEPGHVQPLLEAWRRWRQDLHARWQFDPAITDPEPIF